MPRPRQSKSVSFEELAGDGTRETARPATRGRKRPALEPPSPPPPTKQRGWKYESLDTIKTILATVYRDIIQNTDPKTLGEVLTLSKTLPDLAIQYTEKYRPQEAPLRAGERTRPGTGADGVSRGSLLRLHGPSSTTTATPTAICPAGALAASPHSDPTPSLPASCGPTPAAAGSPSPGSPSPGSALPVRRSPSEPAAPRASPAAVMARPTSLPTTPASMDPHPPEDDAAASPPSESDAGKKATANAKPRWRDTPVEEILALEYSGRAHPVPLATAQSLVHGLQGEKSTHSAASLYTEPDVRILSALFLVDMFGERGRARLAKVVTHHLSTATGEALRGAEAASQVRSDLEKEGQQQLAELASRWADVVREEEGLGAAGSYLSLLYNKAKLVQLWNSVTQQPERELDVFLKSRGYKTRSFPSRVGDFLADRMGLDNKKILTDRIYRAQPVATLVDLFGCGVLPFIPPNIHTSIRGLSTGGGMSKEQRFAHAAQAVRSQVPNLQRLCDAAQASLVDPLLRRAQLPKTKATVLSRDGRAQEAIKLSMWEIVEHLDPSAIVPPQGRIVETANTPPNEIE
ncbi:hypothetical protein GQ53DRAFT_834950 [Thozetella sp. PMI_491]|nr:hypothetical protein GQ53DRAFT_834950 [Thozetella sp. PMI_491]